MTQISDHSINAFVPFQLEFGKSLKTTMSQLVAEPVKNLAHETDRTSPGAVREFVPNRIRPALEGRYSKEVIFDQVVRNRNTDLHVPVYQMLSGGMPDRYKLYKANKRVLDLLNQSAFYEKDTPREARYKYRLAMCFSAAALKRLRDNLLEGEQGIPNELIIKGQGDQKDRFFIPITIENIQIHHFATNRIICQVSLKVSDFANLKINSSVIQEMIDHSARFAKLAWIEESPYTKDTKVISEIMLAKNDPSFSLGDLVARLVHGPAARSQFTFRTYTHSFIRIESKYDCDPTEKMDNLAAMLSRQYNSDYKLNVATSKFKIQRDFDNIRHGFANEGSTTIIALPSNEEAIPFIENFAANSLESIYLPLIVLNLHHKFQCLHLNTLSQLESDNPIADVIDADIDSNFNYDTSPIFRKWKDLQNQLVILNTRFCFPYVSQISMHNEYHWNIYNAIGLNMIAPQLEADLSNLNNSVQTVLSLREANQRDSLRQKYSFFPQIGLAYIAGFSFLQLSTTILDLNNNGLILQEKVILLLTLVSAIVGYIWAAGKLNMKIDK